MGVGQDLLDPALAGAAARPAAVVEGLQGTAHLIALAARRIQEAVHPDLHVTEGEVRGDACAQESEADTQHQHQRQAGDEKLHRPNGGNDHGHADVRLHQQQHGDGGE